jgi:hypothetical protein
MGITPGVPCTPPAHDWPRAGGGTSVGGRILDGCNRPAEWSNRYIFGDYVQNDIWTIEVNAGRDAMVAGSVQDFASSDGPIAFRMGTDNALYIVEAKGGGSVSRITVKGGTATANSCPAVNDPAGNNPGGGAGGGGNAGSPGGGDSPGAGNGTGGTMAGGGIPGNPGAGSGNPGMSGSSPGTAGSGSGGSGDEGGCGCRVAGAGGSRALGFGALAGALGLSWLRRRRGRRA